MGKVRQNLVFDENDKSALKYANSDWLLSKEITNMTSDTPNIQYKETEKEDLESKDEDAVKKSFFTFDAKKYFDIINSKDQKIDIFKLIDKSFFIFYLIAIPVSLFSIIFLGKFGFIFVYHLVFCAFYTITGIINSIVEIINLILTPSEFTAMYFIYILIGLVLAVFQFVNMYMDKSMVEEGAWFFKGKYRLISIFYFFYFYTIKIYDLYHGKGYCKKIIKILS